MSKAYGGVECETWNVMRDACGAWIRIVQSRL